MDTHNIINEHNTNTRINNDSPLDNSAFLLYNGFMMGSVFHDHPFEISDIEMMSLQSVGYTSLKDLLPVSPPAIPSPTNNSSWCEIPIKNPLVKQAALAYLQPMSIQREVGEKGLFGKLKEKFCSHCECFGWINDVIFRSVKEVLWERSEEEIDEEDDDEKVD